MRYLSDFPTTREWAKLREIPQSFIGPLRYNSLCHAERIPSTDWQETWFLLFNTLAIAYLIATKTLQFDVPSIVGCGLALVIVNSGAVISARRFPEWK